MNTDKILQLIRFPNLLMLVIMQLLLRYALAVPVMMMEGVPMLLSNEEVILLILSCALIAAGGYVINDIQDIEIDRVNRPDRLIISKYITVNQAYNLYYSLTGVGVLIGLYLSYYARIQYVGTIIAVTAGMLYFYSTTYKCIPLLGNLIISLIMAATVFIMAFPEPLLLTHQGLFSMFTGFAVFAFLYTLIRELIKDLEDRMGDGQADCKTLVHVAGERAVKMLAAFVLFSTIVLLVLIQITTKQWESRGPFIYLTLLVTLPSIYLLIKIMRSKNSKDYHTCSTISKLIMLSGTFSLMVFFLSL